MSILSIIAGGSQDAARTATDAIRAAESNSPMAQARASRAARMALSDPQARFTEAERREIATLLDNDRDAAPIRLRVTADERAHIERMAQDAGLSISDLIRQRMGL